MRVYHLDAELFWCSSARKSNNICTTLSRVPSTNCAFSMSSRHTFIPKRLGDRFACVFFIVCLVVVINFELRTVLPLYHKPYTTWWFIHVFCALFAAQNVFTNLYLMMVTDTTTGSASLPCVLKQGWVYCPFCELNSPPRSFHCQICDTCILKRDHHCIFGGRCVGYKNYRYYIMMVAFLWFGAVYANIYHFEFVHDIAGGFKMATFFTMFMPFIMLIFGYATTYQFYVLFIAGVSVFSLMLFTVLLFWQWRLISGGQVAFEKKQGVTKYNLGLLENIKDVLGKKWYIAWISPFVPSPLPGDGVSFRAREDIYDIKKM